MKLSDIFEAYLDKFYRSELGQTITKPGFTFNDLADYLEKKHIYLNLVPTDAGFGSASTVDLNAETQHYRESGEPVPDHVQQLIDHGYTHMLQLDAPHTIDFSNTLESTGEKNNIISILQHELQHVLQPYGSAPDYIGIGNIRTAERDVRYLIQAMERPAQAVNIANDLLELNITPDEFIADIKEVEKQALSNIHKAPDTLVHNLRNGAYFNIGPQWPGTIILANAKVSRIKSPIKELKESRKKFKAQLRVFLKKLKETYKRIKGYQQRYHQIFMSG